MNAPAIAATRTGSAAAPVPRPLAGSADWSVSEVVCSAGPADPAYEERHDRFAMALVISGSFRYRSDSGTAVLYPGSVLLGNAGCCFECGHEHGSGDRCLAVHLDREPFAEIAASCARSSRYRFAAPLLPAGPALLPAVIELQALHGSTSHLAAEQLVLRFAESIATLAAGANPRAARSPTAREARRIGAALRHLAEAPHAEWDLSALAATASMSKYHFLRGFRRLYGTTPHQYLLERRLHHAAMLLRSGEDAVSAIALAAGFSDLSSFNRRFRAVFGLAPSRFRARFRSAGEPPQQE